VTRITLGSNNSFSFSSREREREREREKIVRRTKMAGMTTMFFFRTIQWLWHSDCHLSPLWNDDQTRIEMKTVSPSSRRLWRQMKGDLLHQERTGSIEASERSLCFQKVSSTLVYLEDLKTLFSLRMVIPRGEIFSLKYVLLEMEFRAVRRRDLRFLLHLE
jgi:hypothetical protein